jgi:hypothetical protein
MGQVMADWRRVAEEGNCCVELVHHTRKGQGETGADDIRGAASIMGAVRSARLLSVMSAKEAADSGISEEQRRFHIWVNPTGKPSLIPPASERQWLRLESVDLGNCTADYPDGDKMGVLVPWEPPNHSTLRWTDMSHCEAAWWAIRQAPPDKRRSDIQSNGWIGYLVMPSLGLDLADPQAKSKAKAAIDAWKGSGLLFMESATIDSKSKPVLTIKWEATQVPKV